MTQEDLARFFRLHAEDSQLQQALASASTFEELVHILNSHGCNATIPELLRFNAAGTLELSDQELEAVSGGLSPAFLLITSPAMVIGAGAGAVGGAVAAATATVC